MKKAFPCILALGAAFAPIVCAQNAVGIPSAEIAEAAENAAATARAGDALSLKAGLRKLAASAEKSRAVKEIVINAREEDGELVMTIGGKAVTLDSLAEMLKRAAEANPDQPVRIVGDADMRWQKVADVISACTQAGVSNVSFSKQMPKEEK